MEQLNEADKIAALKKEYEEQLEINRDADRRIENGNRSDALEDLARSGGHMDGMSRACFILTGHYITELF